MAKAPTMLELLDKYEPELKKAFLAAIDEITSKVVIADVARALQRGDIQGAIDALHLDPTAFAVFERAIETTYNAGGVSTIQAAGILRDAYGIRFVVRFDARNIRAETWLKSKSSELVTGLIQEQRETVRNSLTAGMEAGRAPRDVALDIVGRINPVTGRRDSGVIGLASNQEAAVRKAREELEAGEYAKYRQRARRDKRFDRAIAAAEREGKPLTKEQIEKAIARYSDRLLKLRGETIARTEALASLHAAQHEGLLQMIDTGKVRADQIEREWSSTGDMRVRRDHVIADGQKRGVYEAFFVGGESMMYPGVKGASAKNVIGCRCSVRLNFNFLKGVR